MNPLNRTLGFVGVAAVSAVIAFSAYKASQPDVVSGYGDVGQEFFPDFQNVDAAAALTVADYDDEKKEGITFAVRQNDNGLWVIPSHKDYPAEAEDRLARTATSLMGVRKAAVQSRSKDDWKRYGVIDPDEDGAATADERGTRLTLSDGSGNPLVDLIIGNQVEGRDGDYYVREPEKNTTYIASLDVDLSAKFSDWIEPDLLKINASDLVSITLDNYSVNEQRGTVEKKELLEFTKEDLKSSGTWTLAGLDDAAEELDSSPVGSIATNLDNLKIVDVLKKPEGLDDNLRINPAIKQLLQAQMQAQGYFIGGDKDGNERLYANEGELIAGTQNGVEYTLYFGEIARDSSKDIEVDLNKEEAEEAATEESTDTEDGPRRYLLVKVNFNEALLGEKPIAPVEPQKPDILNEAADDAAAPAAEPAKPESATEEEPEEKTPEDDGSCSPDEEAADEASEAAADESSTDENSEESKAAAPSEQPAEDGDKQADSKPEAASPADAPESAEEKKEEQPPVDPKKVAQEEYDKALQEYQANKSRFDSDLKSFEDKVKQGQEKAEELSTRFAGWYYVISSDSFEKFRITRNDVVSKKEVKEEAASEGEEAAGDK